MTKNDARRTEILVTAAAGRRDSVLNYQINIDNFRLAIIKIETEHANNPAMTKFADDLRGLLTANETEQLKELIMLEVLEQQLEGQDVR